MVSHGAGPPMHVHYQQEEVFTVQEGRIGHQRPGEPEQFAGPGETITFKAGEPHRSEFALLTIPMTVQRVAFPALVTVGRLPGMYGKYANAPAPVRR